MGRVKREIIDIQEQGIPSALTTSGSAGFLSTGYLKDKPAEEYLDSDETPVFVLTNEKKGVEIEVGGDTRQVQPGSRYQTVAVATGRRLLVVVGAAAEGGDGDRSFSVQFTDVEDVDVARQNQDRAISRTSANSRVNQNRDRLISFASANGRVIRLPAGGRGLADVVEFFEAAVRVWTDVEETVGDVKQSLVTATAQGDDGDYAAAIEAAESAGDALEGLRSRVVEFTENWPADAIHERIDKVAGRYVQTVAEIRFERATTLAEQAQSRWENHEYKAAYDAYVTARDEYATLSEYKPADVPDPATVREEAERIDRIVEQLDGSPLVDAAEADRRAQEADDPADSATALAEAVDHYRRALDAAREGEEESQVGDPGRIRDRLEGATERLVEKQCAAASETEDAGDWYLGADQYELAREEFEVARELYERAHEVASDSFPDRTDRIEAAMDDLDERLERVDAALAEGEAD